jgi:hypothetical protein
MNQIRSAKSKAGSKYKNHSRSDVIQESGTFPQRKHGNRLKN